MGTSCPPVDVGPVSPRRVPGPFPGGNSGPAYRHGARLTSALGTSVLLRSREHVPPVSAGTFVLVGMGIVVSLETRRQGRPRRDGTRSDRARTAFYFDLCDPGTYLAAERVDRLFPGLSWVPASAAALRAVRGGAPVGLGDEEAMARAALLRMPLVWPE